MIVVLTSADTYSGFEKLAGRSDFPEVRVLTFADAFAKPRLFLGTYIFVPDHLSRDQLAQAGRLARRLQESGCRILNDPATWRPRFSLLRALHRAGMNPFDIYAFDERSSIRRYPVFVRSDAHADRLTGLLNSPAELEQALEALRVAGAPLANLMIVEYAAEPVRPGVFRRLGVTRIGNKFIAGLCVHDRNWFVSQGQAGIAPEDLYDDELRIVRTNAYAEEMAPVFDLAGVQHGRVDFGLVDGKPCVYEINTGPSFQLGLHSPVPQRREALALWAERFMAALWEIDSAPASGSGEIDCQGASIPALRTARDVYPDNFRFDLDISREYERRGELAEAAHWLMEAMRLAPADPDLAFKAGNLLITAGEAKRALPVIEAALASTERDWRLHYAASRILSTLGKHPEAIAAAERACELAPQSWQTHYQLGLSFFAAGQLQPALEVIRKAHAVSDRVWQISYQESRILAALGQQTEAIVAAERACELAPEQWSTHYQLSAALLTTGARDEALRACETAASLNPTNAQVAERLTRLQTDAGSV